jgi:hypothetical protein
MAYLGSKEIALLCAEFKLFHCIERDMKEIYARVGCPLEVHKRTHPVFLLHLYSPVTSICYLTTLWQETLDFFL